MTDSGDRSPAAHRSSSLGLLWLIVLALVAGELVLWAAWVRRAPPIMDPDAQPKPVVARGTLDKAEKTTIAIFKEASPSVAYITTLSGGRTGVFSFDPRKVVEGTGSGVVWDQQGHVVTNAHVVAGAEVARVTLADRTTWKASMVGAFVGGDLAVVSIAAPPERLHPITIGASEDLQVGQSVLAIGDPFGLDQTLTTGIVSALNREMRSKAGRPITGLIQTDAPINPGNSGGPLLDSSGRMIGLNSAIVSPSGAFAGIGFAIPVDHVNRIVTQIIRTGEVSLPSLGVVLAPHTLQRQLDLDGVLVLGVIPGGPAAVAGIRPTTRLVGGGIDLGDAIVAIDGNGVASVKQYYKLLDTYRVGDTVTVTVDRGRRKVDVGVRLATAE